MFKRTIFLVRGGLACFIPVVEEAGQRKVALRRRHPQIGATGIKEHSKLLPGRPDLNHPIVLRVQVIRQRHFLTSTHLINSQHLLRSRPRRQARPSHRVTVPPLLPQRNPSNLNTRRLSLLRWPRIWPSVVLGRHSSWRRSDVKLRSFVPIVSLEAI
ncbi:hypothetical protein KC19_4G211000 [Ceratodon purpureus]|uniref:Uncharacterized protein n=1 Tax=Ceratodon purpureus TaxID=3225 RepID=A0A8T0IBY4_CERPU|nr:hypothetical protein KC19_4G211000 [Ceratodon purpureus]